MKRFAARLLSYLPVHTLITRLLACLMFNLLN